MMKLNIDLMTEEMKRFDMFVNLMSEYVGPEVVLKLKSMGFFTAPASTRYHGNYEGGLFDHSYEVTKALVNMTEKLGLKWEKERSPYIVGMFHDLCKTDDYVKTDGGWVHNDNVFIRAHGVKSVILTMDLLNPLTDEEIMCIYWHMGAFDDKDNWNRYGKACTQFPNVLYTHTADMIAARIVGI